MALKDVLELPSLNYKYRVDEKRATHIRDGRRKSLSYQPLMTFSKRGRGFVNLSIADRLAAKA